MNDRELTWKQYDKHIELYKFYWEIVVKINVFHFAISGAILGFYFSHRSTQDVQWSLLLPAFFSVCWAVVFLYGAATNLVSRDDVFAIRDKLGLQVAPEFLVLTIVLSIFAIAHLITTAALIYLMYGHCN